MAMRLFGSIQGAILLVVLLFGLLINILGWEPPENAKRAFETEFVVRELSIRAESGGVKTALSTRESIAAAHPGFRLARAPTCTGETMITGDMGQCLALSPSDPTTPVLSAVEPIVLPLLIGAVSSATVSRLMSQWITRSLRVVGHGLASADLEARFLPFVRLGEEPYSEEVGLGLAIAASSVKHHSRLSPHTCERAAV